MAQPTGSDQPQPPPEPLNDDTLDRLKAVPPTPPPAPPPQPSQYQPQPPSAGRPPPVAPFQAETGIPPVRPGETVCANCRWGNDPTRTFCRHCGSPLTGGGVVPPPPPAGPQYVQSAPRGPRRWPWILGAVLGAIVLVLAGGLLARALTNGGTVAEESSPSASPSPSPTPKGQEVPGDDIVARASTSQPDAEAQYLIDGDEDTYWAANPTESNPDPIPRLTFTLKSSDGARVVRMEVVSGGREGEYDSRPRPKDICVRVDAGDCIEHELEDSPDAQEIRVDAAEPAKQIEIEIKSVYPATQDGGAADNVTMREVRLYAQP
ncbi:hypothetical protein F4553_001289 [Allocatelliglobosispora scoriae]|uniref:Uncharacterized protein n=1 Tax=Allocatelliglobosispora scoriae TaxID=643052 RepID=A0A841BM62_9ACTN|nr:zinc ribbon domain-containing protein [Allocatelliglobosispora scoriae]MBB5867910.1 hypothetical protein [Allocatelliglobosispora scoriae]